MNIHPKAIARRLTHAASGLALVLCLAATAAGAQSEDSLSLAQTPLFTSSNVPPNVLVAMDNSRTMDFETLFDTRNGALYWKVDDVDSLLEALGNIVDNLTSALGLTAKKEEGSFWNDDTDQLVQASTHPYVSLFPNGYNYQNNSNDKFRRVNNVENAGSNSLLGLLNNSLVVPITDFLGLGSIGDLTRLLDSDAPLELDNVLDQLGLGIVNNVIDATNLVDWYSQYVDYYAVPPLPRFAFTRSPNFNKLYFDPSETYQAWPGYPDANTTAAPFDPAELPGSARSKPSLSGSGDNRINLTQVFRRRDNGYRFDLRGAMDPENSEHRFWGKKACGFLDLGTCDDWVYKNKRGLFTGIFEFLKDIIFTKKRGGKLGMEYYPATFYMESSTAPSIQGCKNLLRDISTEYINYAEQVDVITHNGTPALGGNAEGDSVMCGYEIKPGTDAMQNFANWFTYYRKRHLAARGGLTSALDSVGGLRFGYMPTSNAIDDEADLSMTDVDYDTDRSSLYNGIYDIDFSMPRGTPNRQALDFLRIQLEDNAGIVQKACQRNLSMIFTDGYNTGAVNSVGNFDGQGGGDADGDDSGFYDDQTERSIYADSASNTIADIAMAGYEELSTDFTKTEIENNPVPVPSSCDSANPDPRLDCNKQPHMNTSGVTLGQRGTVYDPDPEKLTALENDIFSGNPPWNSFDPNKLGRAQIDDLWHATINGRGDMLNARTPADIADSFKGVLADILTNSGSGSDIGVKSGYLGDDSVAYRAGFTSGAWSGDLSARAIGTDDAQLGPEPSWQAARQLIDQDPGNRVILTSVGQSAKAFQWNALKNTQAIQDKSLVNYIRGNQSNELANGGTYRTRGDNILGDIVHSTPLYVGAPGRVRYPADWNDQLQDGNQTTPEDVAGSYPTFLDNQSGRDSMIYVGANDGMLHGFDAATGVEKLAYVPNGVLDNLAALADPNYSHRYYVDGTPVAGDVVYGGQWHTVLVGGLRAGGRSIYALDITNPGSFSEDNPGNTVLWEFSDNKLGYTYGKPSIVRLHDGTWAALFGNGYNSGDEADASDDSAGLFIVPLDKSASTTPTWISTIPGASEESGPNGLGEVFPVDIDGDFITDYAYAGDLQGNLWRFDLTDTSSANWTVSRVFTAEDNSGKAQPITSQPQVGAHRYGLDYGVMVYFGTGKYLEDSDRTSSANNTFYGIWDPDVVNADTTEISGAASRTDLLAQTVILEKDSSGQTYRAVTNESIDYTPNSDTWADSYDRGWLLDLPADGERVVSNAQLQEGSRGKNYTVAFSTLTPGTPTACGAAGGGFFMVLNQLNGGRTEKPIFDLNGDNMFNPTDDTLEKEDGTSVTASGVRIRGGIPGAATHQSSRGDGKAFYIIPTTDGTTTTINIPLLGKDGRVNWREIRR